jgi:hypothetical protein
MLVAFQIKPGISGQEDCYKARIVGKGVPTISKV